MKGNTLGTLLAAATMAFVLTGCDQDGPAEQAGEKIDNAVEKAGDKIEEAGDKVQDSVDR